MYPGHGGGYGHPPGAKNAETTHPGGHKDNPVPDGPEGSGALGWEAPFHAPRGSGCGGSLVPHPTSSDLEESGQGMDVVIFSV